MFCVLYTNAASVDETYFKGEITSPVPGTECDELYSFQLNFADATGTISVGTPVAVMSFYDPTKDSWGEYSELVSEVTDGVASVRLPYYPVNSAGKYSITIPKGAFVFEQESGDKISSDEIIAEFTIVSTVKPYDIEINPAEGNVTSIDVLTFKFTTLTGAYMWDSPVENGAAAFDENGNLLGRGSLACGYGENWVIEYTIDFENEITNEGYCRVVIGSGIIDTDYDAVGDNECVEFYYNITGETSEPFKGEITSPVPGTECDELYSFQLNFADATGTISVGTPVAVMSFYDPTKDSWGEYSELVSEVTDGVASVRLPYYPVNSAGKYSITIPKGAFVFEQESGDKISSDEIIAEFTIVSTVKPYDIEINPAEGNVTSIDVLTFKFTTLTGAYMWDSPVENGAAAFDENGNLLGRGSLACGYGENWVIEYTIDFENEITNEGYCRVVIGSGIIDTDYDAVGDNECIEFYYNITGEAGEPFKGEITSPTPGSECEELYSFQLNFADATGTISVGTPVATMSFYDPTNDSWVEYSELVSEITDGVASVRLPYYPVNSAGKYSVTIPKGAFVFEQESGDKISSDEITAEFTIVSTVKPYDIEINPAEGNVTSLDVLIFKFTTLTGAYMWTSPAENGVAAFDENGNLLGRGSLACGYGENWVIEYTIDFENEITNEGYCRVVVGSGLIDTNSDAVGDNECIEFYYNITGEAGEPFKGKITSPTPGSECEELYSFQLNFADATGTISVGTPVATMSFYDPTNDSWVEYSELVSEITDGVASVRLPYYPVNSAGKYSVTIPKGAFVFEQESGDKISSDEITAEFTIVSTVKPYDIEINPAEGNVTSLDVLIFKFTTLTGAYMWTSPAENGVAAFDENGNLLGRGSLACGYGENWVIEYTIDFENEITNEGYCRVVIGSGLIDTNSDAVGDNECIEFYYNITGQGAVDKIFADTQFDVYTLNGILIKSGVDKEEIINLDNGIYIINGKKVLINR